MITLLDASVDEVLAACRTLRDDGRVGSVTAEPRAVDVAGSAERYVDVAGSAERFVDAADREAAARRQRPSDARRTLAGRAALRLLAAARLGVPVGLASQIVVDRTCSTCRLPHGRPRIAGLSVSTSSADGRVLVAVADEGADEGADLGVDIERVPSSVFDGFDDFVLHPDERGRFAVGTGSSSETEARLTCWVEKEAVLKAVGVGLASPPHELLVAARSVDHTLPSCADMIGPWEWRPVEQAGATEAVGLSVTELPTKPGYRAAIAARVPTRIHAVDIDSITTQIASSEGLRA